MQIPELCYHGVLKVHVGLNPACSFSSFSSDYSFCHHTGLRIYRLKMFPLFNQVLVLSGHDHDQCTVDHKTKYGTVKEVITGE